MAKQPEDVPHDAFIRQVQERSPLYQRWVAALCAEWREQHPRSKRTMNGPTPAA